MNKSACYTANYPHKKSKYFQKVYEHSLTCNSTPALVYTCMCLYNKFYNPDTLYLMETPDSVYFGSVKFKLTSHSFFANSASLARLDGLAMLLSIKYSPLTPLTCGFNAT